MHSTYEAFTNTTTTSGVQCNSVVHDNAGQVSGGGARWKHLHRVAVRDGLPMGFGPQGRNQGSI